MPVAALRCGSGQAHERAPRDQLEEALRCLLVPLGTEQKVDRLAGAVDGPVQVAPLPADSDVRFINVPRPAARTQVAAHPLLQLRGEALDPAVHGRVIDHHAAIGEHSLKIAIADRELQVPAHRPQDYLGREAKAAECSGGVGHEWYSRRDVGGSTAPTWARCPAQCNRSDQGGGRPERTSPDPCYAGCSSPTTTRKVRCPISTSAWPPSA